LPSELLRRRPDIARRANLVAANANIGIARAQLSHLVADRRGWINLSDFLADAHNSFGRGSNIAATLFDNGASGNVDLSEARARNSRDLSGRGAGRGRRSRLLAGIRWLGGEAARNRAVEYAREKHNRCALSERVEYLTVLDPSAPCCRPRTAPCRCGWRG
jgi:hypothetical protein